VHEIVSRNYDHAAANQSRVAPPIVCHLLQFTPDSQINDSLTAGVAIARQIVTFVTRQHKSANLNKGRLVLPPMIVILHTSRTPNLPSGMQDPVSP
jgi:hypothetical protein